MLKMVDGDGLSGIGEAMEWYTQNVPAGTPA